VRIECIVIKTDPYEPFRLAQGYQVGDLLFISGQAATRRTDKGRIVAGKTLTRKLNKHSET
jgi:enamine deaminase RidA (YjgF/YER057c/UK114 family)